MMKYHAHRHLHATSLHEQAHYVHATRQHTLLLLMQENMKIKTLKWASLKRYNGYIQEGLIY